MTFSLRCLLLPAAAALGLLTALPAAHAVTTIADPTPPAPPALPVKPFFASLQVQNTPVSAGPATAKLGITNLTITNFDTSAQQVFIFVPLFASGGICGSPVTGGTSPRLQIYVQPSQTLVIPYPTALVVSGQHPNCIAAEVTTILHGGSVEVDVTGFAQ